MPLITTHNYFANDVLNNCNTKIANKIRDNKPIYELFAQGFDPFHFYNFFCSKKEMNLQYYCHTTNTDLFFLNFIKNIKENNLKDNSEILAALYGHLTHYVLDYHCHPFVVYKTGLYKKSKPETIKYNGLHSKMEMQIDAFLYYKKTNKSYNKFNIHTHLITKQNFSDKLIDVLNKTYKEALNIEYGGNKYEKGSKLMYYSYKFLIVDKTGLKKKAYKFIDKITPSKESKYEYFSAYVKNVDKSIFNNEKTPWLNPWTGKENKSSFFDLYNQALKTCMLLFEATDKYINDKISTNEYKKILKDYSYLTGISYKKDLEIKYLEF